MSLRETATALARRELGVTDHIEQTLARLDELADTPWANLIAARDDVAALTRAAALDTELADDGWRSPLHGVAVAVKDNIDVAGLPTRCGSAELADAPPAEADAWIVDRLRQAGAIVVAKTHLHEFAYGPTGTVNAAGPAANPHDPTRMTGGSSSGSAALVARGIVPVALGTDTGCSVRTPAALCGVTGLRPTTGALSTRGVFPLSATLDQVGLLTADAVDMTLAWGAIPGVAHLAAPVDGLTVGRLIGPLWEPQDPAIEVEVDRACDALEAAGAQVREVRLPHDEELSAGYPIIVGSEALELHSARLPGAYEPATASRLLASTDVTAVEYLGAVRAMRRLRDDALQRLRAQGVDALIAATAPVRAPELGTESVGGRTVHEELLRMCVPLAALGVPSLSVPAPDVDGLPIGIQVAGLTAPSAAARGTHPAEDLVFALALALEA